MTKDANGKVIKKITIDYGSDSYKEGIYDGRKQTLEEVLKWINDNWTEHRSFGFSIKEHLEQKLKAME
jgi:hypothetical protein